MWSGLEFMLYLGDIWSEIKIDGYDCLYSKVKNGMISTANLVPSSCIIWLSSVFILSIQHFINDNVQQILTVKGLSSIAGSKDSVLISSDVGDQFHIICTTIFNYIIINNRQDSFKWGGFVVFDIDNNWNPFKTLVGTQKQS